MLDFSRVEQLLHLQKTAYGLVVWLAEAVVWDPQLLLPAEAEKLSRVEGANQWLNAHSVQIPVALLPRPIGEEFVQLFASFFSTSFHAEHFEWNGQLIQSGLKLGVETGKSSIANPAQCEFLALNHLCSAEKICLSDKEIKALARGATLSVPLAVWTYVWELDRRARGKGKGAVVHQIWRRIPPETRKNLNAASVWNCKMQLVEGVRNYLARAKVSELR